MFKYCNPYLFVPRITYFILPLCLLLVMLFTSSHAQIVYNFAGNGTGGFNGDSLISTATQLYGPQGLCFDRAGNLIVAENDGARIRKINLTNGLVTTIAGTGVPGYAGDGGLATQANFNHPIKVAVDSAGNIFVLDFQNNVIRKVAASTGVISTFAGMANGMFGFSGDGGPATQAMLYIPLDIALDKAGNLYVADYLNNRVRRVDKSTGIISTVAGNGNPAYNGDNIAATSAALRPISIAIDSNDNIYISDLYNFRIRKIDAQTGLVTTVVGTGVQGVGGDDGPPTNAQLASPVSLRLDKQQNLYITDQFGTALRKVDFNSNIITKVAGLGINGYNGDGLPATQTMFYSPQDCAIAQNNDIYIADKFNQRVRKIDNSCYELTCENVYTFIGDGLWSLPQNWYNNMMPPTPLPKGAKIVINPSVNGKCVLDILQGLLYGSALIVKPNKVFHLNDNLVIQ